MNATQAAIRAGYSEKTAYSIGSELLKKPEIKNRIEELMAEINEPTIAKAEEVLEYLTSVMRGEEKESSLRGVGNGVQKEYYKTPSVTDRTKAAELLGKRYGLYVDKVETTDDIQIEIVSKDEDN